MDDNGNEQNSPRQSTNQVGKNVKLSNTEVEKLAVNLERTIMNQKVVEEKGDQVERNELVDIPTTNETKKIPLGRHQLT